MAITTSSILPAPVQQSFNMKLLSVPTPNFIHNIPAKEYEMPRNGGTTMRFRRPNRLAAALVPLGNSGVTPAGQQLTAVDRLNVHVKSSLIDLETLASYIVGNKAQAGVSLAA